MHLRDTCSAEACTNRLINEEKTMLLIPGASIGNQCQRIIDQKRAKLVKIAKISSATWASLHVHAFSPHAATHLMASSIA